MVIGGGRLELLLQYDALRFDHETVDRLLTHLVEICRQIVSDTGVLGDVSVVSESERQILLGTVEADSTEDVDAELAELIKNLSEEEEQALLDELSSGVDDLPPDDHAVVTRSENAGTSTTEGE